MAQAGMYKSPIFLNSVTHKSVHIAPLSDFQFAKDLNSVVIVGQEFLEAAKFFPLAFTRSQDNEIIPIALLGLRAKENLFVDADGKWKEGAYVPAFFRRYPFILASNVGEDASFAVCVDSNYEGFDKKEGMRLFDDKGKSTEEFKRVVEFLKNYHVQHEGTKAMIKLLDEYKLFKDVTANITLPAGEKLGFAKLMMVDESAMLQLDDTKAMTLFRRGYLAWIYAHLYSLSNFRSLMALADAAGTATAAKDSDAADKDAKKKKKK